MSASQRTTVAITGVFALSSLFLAPLASGVGTERLLVGDTFGDSIHEFDLDSGQYVRTLVPPGYGGLDEPADMAIGPDGALYVANVWGGNILKYDLNSGEFLGVFASGFDIPTGITYADDQFYVPARADMAIYRLDADTGAVTGQTEPYPDGASVWWPVDAEVNADGKLLMSNYERHNILAFDAVSLAFDGVFAESYDASRIGNMEIGPDGDIHLVGNDSWVYRFDGLSGATKGRIPVPDIDETAGLAVAADGTLYITGHREPGIVHLDADTGELLRVLDPAGAHTSGSWCMLIVPEPASLCLLALGGLAALWRKR